MGPPALDEREHAEVEVVEVVGVNRESAVTGSDISSVVTAAALHPLNTHTQKGKCTEGGQKLLF